METVVSSLEKKLGERTKKDVPLQVLWEEVGKKETAMLDAARRFQERLQALQSACPHENVNKKFEPIGFGNKVLVEKKCSDCGLDFKKPEGPSWKMCQRCWEPMGYVGYAQGQDYREHSYKCTSCGHIESRT